MEAFKNTRALLHIYLCVLQILYRSHITVWERILCRDLYSGNSFVAHASNTDKCVLFSFIAFVLDFNL